MKNSLFILGLCVCIVSLAQTSSSRKTFKTKSSSDGTSSESSITRSEEFYEFEARYDREKNEAVKELLLDRLGSSYLEVRGKTYEWTKEKGGREFFSCLLENKEVYLRLNTEVASDDFYDLIDELGDDLRDLVQAHKPYSWAPMTPMTPQPPNPNSTDPQLYEEQLRQAERELARAQRNLERLKKKN